MPDILCKIAVANREYESWLLASLESLRGRHGVSETALLKNDPESIRDAKKELSKYMEHKYSPTVEQTTLILNSPVNTPNLFSYYVSIYSKLLKKYLNIFHFYSPPHILPKILSCIKSKNALNTAIGSNDVKFVISVEFLKLYILQNIYDDKDSYFANHCLVVYNVF